MPDARDDAAVLSFSSGGVSYGVCTILLVAALLPAQAHATCASLSSSATPLVDFSAFSARNVDASISGDGVIAGSCRSQGFDYVLAFPQYDSRGLQWSRDAADAILSVPKQPGTLGQQGQQPATPLCGYDYSLVHDLAKRDGADCPLVVDVGAHVGLSVLPAAARGLRVLAFEPIPRNLALLKLNAFLNGWGAPDSQVGVVHAAASATTGEVSIFSPVGHEDNSAIGRGDAAAATANVGAVKAVKHRVASVALDDYFGGASRHLAESLRLVKIDTQGHELNVLRGMRRLLERTDLRFRIILELDFKLQRAAGHREDDLLGFMKKLGWLASCIVTRGGQQTLVPQNKSHHAVPKCSDVVFERK